MASMKKNAICFGSMKQDRQLQFDAMFFQIEYLRTPLPLLGVLCINNWYDKFKDTGSVGDRKGTADRVWEII